MRNIVGLLLLFSLSAISFARLSPCSVGQCGGSNGGVSPSGGFAELHSGTFDGSTTLVDMGSNHPSININGCVNPFGIGVWVYQTDGTGFQEVITERDIGGSFAGIELGITGGNPVIDLAQDSSNKIELTFTSITIALNQWYLLFWTTDGTGTIAGQNLTACTLGTCTTVNGNSASSTSAGTVAGGNCTSTVAPFRIGARNNGGLKFVGQIDEAGYFSSAPSTLTIGNYYNFGAPLDMSSASGLGSWWRFENSGTSPPDSTSTIYDRKGTNNGTNTNVAFSTNVPTTNTLTATFNGTSSQGNFGTPFNWDYTQPFSIVAWVNPQFQPHGGTGPGEAQQTVVCNATFSGGEGSLTITPGYRFSLLDNPNDTGSAHTLAPYLQIFHDNSHRVEYFGTLVDMLGHWQMVGVSYGGCGHPSCVHIYYNGSEQGTDPLFTNTDTLGGLSSAAGTNPLLLGVVTYPDAGPIPYYFKGNMANLNVWKRELSASDFASLYSLGMAVIVRSAVPTTIFSSYPMQSPSNEDLNDPVSGNNGTPTSITWSHQ